MLNDLVVHFPELYSLLLIAADAGSDLRARQSTFLTLVLILRRETSFPFSYLLQEADDLIISLGGGSLLNQ